MACEAHVLTAGLNAIQRWVPVLKPECVLAGLFYWTSPQQLPRMCELCESVRVPASLFLWPLWDG